MHHRFIWAHLAALLLLLSSISLSGGAPAQAALPLDQISANLAGQPIAAGDYLFWLDRRDGGAISGYQRSRARSFVVAALGPQTRVAQLVSDGRTLAWLDLSGAIQRIRRYDLLTQRFAMVELPSRQPAIADMTLVDDVLYYWDAAPDHRGIFAHYLASGQERQLRSLPRATAPGRLKIAGGALVWSEYAAQGAYLPPRATLYLYQLNGRSAERIVVQGQPWSGPFSGFDVAGPWLVWSFALEQQIWLSNLRSGAREVISTGAASRPLIRGATVVWDVWDATAGRSSIAAYSLAERRRTPIVTAGGAYLTAQALVDANTLLVSADHRPALRNELYLAPLPRSRPGVVATIAARPLDRSPSPPTTGQLRVAGRGFVADGAPERRWTFNGVHLILPSRGINGSSFSAEALADPRAAAERRVWLDRAQRIGAQTIRIYVDMPGDTHVATPPAPARIFALARDELAPRGMRLGLVIHNSGRFDDPDGRKMAWLRALLDCFGGGACAAPDSDGVDRTALLAYINADNEINIHRQPLDDLIPGNPDCRPDDPRQPQIAEDCFDHPNPEKRRRYIEQAVSWTALVRATIKQHPTGQPTLITVGMSVDLDKDALGDGQSAVLNYFTPAASAEGRSAQTLADLVDFIAPHSYTALPHWEIVAPIERSAPLFDKPIVLEEFGYPTDPIAQPDPEHPAEFKETSLDLHRLEDGSLQIVANRSDLPPGEEINKLCRYLPKLGVFGERPKRCQPSAPYVVQANLEAIFDMQHFAGGIAFMLADSQEKNDGSKRCHAPDERQQLSKNLFLGLFAIDDRYRCGGTVNTGDGQIKNTGYRVCVAYRTGNTQLGNYRDPVPACALDLTLATPTPIAPTAQPIAPTAAPIAEPDRATHWRMPGALVGGLILLGGGLWLLRRRA
jgi:hypothetical protein